jgi:hypothetical protein
MPPAPSDPSVPTPPRTVAHTRDVVQTYRYLRGAMAGLLLALLLSVVLQWWLGTDRSCWLGSISAYYFTPARTVVVGTLSALGIALIAYEGHSPEENVLLDFSGFMALLVAAVPTVPDTRCGPSPFDETTDEIAAGIGVSVPTLVVVALVALAVVATTRLRSMGDGSTSRAATRTVVLAVGCTAVVVLELVLVTVLRGELVAVAHGVAATTMVTGAIAVMVCSALRVDERHGADPSELATAAAYRRTYLTLALSLGVLLALTVVLHLTVSGFGLTVLVAEVVILVLFGAYWVVQTIELWGLGDGERPEARSVRGVGA